MNFRKTIFIILSGILILLIAFYTYCSHTFQHLCSSPDHIPESFGFPSNSIGEFKVTDAMYNQGRTAFPFGGSCYLIEFDEPKLVISVIRKNGGIETDNKWTLTKQRGNYIGVFSVQQTTLVPFIIWKLKNNSMFPNHDAILGLFGGTCQ